MACRNCYKYPFCEKCESPKESCEDEKNKREMIEELEHREWLEKQVNEMLEE